MNINIDKSFIIDELSEELIKYYPEDYFEVITEPNDISANKSWIVKLDYSDELMRHILSIVLPYVQDDKRFRRADAVNVIKRLMRKVNPDTRIAEDVIDKLFCLLRLFFAKDQYGNAYDLSVALKNRKLNDQHLQWLAKNHKEADYIYNRLMMYPFPNPIVADWAKSEYIRLTVENQQKQGIYNYGHSKSLISRVLSVAIIEDLPSFVSADEHNSVILWAIYYSTHPVQDKITLLKEYVNIQTYEDLDSIKEICSRLDAPEILEYILDTISSQTILDS